jgi:chemotaxis protein MotB
VKGSLESVDEGSYLASVSDLMSGLLFIFVIVTVVYALGLKEQEVIKENEVKRLTGASEERRKLLERIRDDLKNAGVQVTIVPEQGVLRLGEGILFGVGRADLDEKGTSTVTHLATVLAAVLPCYTRSPNAASSAACGTSGSAGRVDALFIEGHTDDLRLSGLGGFKDNWELSTARAKNIYTSLVDANGLLDQLTNDDSQPVLSVSGYADRRGIQPNTSDEARKLNRRIDLRFVMTPPRDAVLEPVRRVQEGLPK